MWHWNYNYHGKLVDNLGKDQFFYSMALVHTSIVVNPLALMGINNAVQ